MKNYQTDNLRLLKENLEKILSLTYPKAKEGDVEMAKLNTIADECLKLLDFGGE